MVPCVQCPGGPAEPPSHGSGCAPTSCTPGTLPPRGCSPRGFCCWKSCSYTRATLSPWKEASGAYPSWAAEEGNEDKEKATQYLLTRWVLVMPVTVSSGHHSLFSQLLPSRFPLIHSPPCSQRTPSKTHIQLLKNLSMISCPFRTSSKPINRRQASPYRRPSSPLSHALLS